jgi:hypothetical protein
VVEQLNLDSRIRENINIDVLEPFEQHHEKLEKLKIDNIYFKYNQT